MEKSAIIVAGGVGTRMKAGIPKQFLLLGGKPMLMYSIMAFHHAYPGIPVIIALPAGQLPTWQELCEQHAFTLPHQIVVGGDTRFQSVKNALSVIAGEGLVAVHDGARPLVSASLIRETFLTAGQFGNCIPVIPLNETVRILTGDSNRAVNRVFYRVVQTPQVFHLSVIKKAYEQDYTASFTDDATVAETMGDTIHLIEGDPVNFKITHPFDLAAAELLIRSGS